MGSDMMGFLLRALNQGDHIQIESSLQFLLPRGRFVERISSRDGATLPIQRRDLPNGRWTARIWAEKTPIWWSVKHDSSWAAPIDFYFLTLLRLSLRPQIHPLSLSL